VSNYSLDIGVLITLSRVYTVITTGWILSHYVNFNIYRYIIKIMHKLKMFALVNAI